MSKFTKIIPFFILFLLSSSSFAMTEIDLNFGYDKTVFGTNRENSVVTRSYSGAITLYFTQYVGLEFNGSSSKDTTTVEEDRELTTDLNQLSRQEIVESNVYGTGLRIMLANRKSFLIPTISIGYARSFVTSNYDILVASESTGVQVRTKGQAVKYRSDNAFGAFALKFRLTKSLALKGSVRTYFPADDFNKAKDNLKYSAGISWIF